MSVLVLVLGKANNRARKPRVMNLPANVKAHPYKTQVLAHVATSSLLNLF